MGTGTDLAGWGGDGDDFHPHAGLYTGGLTFTTGKTLAFFQIDGTLLSRTLALKI